MPDLPICSFWVFKILCYTSEENGADTCLHLVTRASWRTECGSGGKPTKREDQGGRVAGKCQKQKKKLPKATLGFLGHSLKPKRTPPSERRICVPLAQSNLFSDARKAPSWPEPRNWIGRITRKTGSARLSDKRWLTPFRQICGKIAASFAAVSAFSFIEMSSEPAS